MKMVFLFLLVVIVNVVGQSFSIKKQRFAPRDPYAGKLIQGATFFVSLLIIFAVPFTV